jgi:hypothetical protein
LVFAGIPMKIAAWVVDILLLVAGIAISFEALTTTSSVWLSIPMLIFSGMLIGPGLVALLALVGLYNLAIEVNGHRMEFRKRNGQDASGEVSR